MPDPDEVRSVLLKRAELNGKLSGLPYDGTPEIKEVNGLKYLYVRKRAGGKVTSTYVGAFSVDKPFQYRREGDRILTERLILRPFREKDLDDQFEFLSQLENDEFEGYPGITRENAAGHLAERLGSEAFYAMELRKSGKVIGNLYFGDRDFDAKEAGYIVNGDYRRRGYALEALRAVTLDAFDRGAHRVYAECDPRNTRSWKLLEKAGFRREAHLRKNVWFRRGKDGAPVWKDTYIYAMLGEDVLR